ncbi:MAG TPA: TfoX/Sxy family protein [Gemmatimonadales bacterium]|nr:TfoX/Sxy family protein [Gemmatimonadales bacterium]
MPVSPSYRTFVLEQLGRVTPNIRARSMFGGVGIYGSDRFFALMDDDLLYFKVDDTNRPDFEAAGMGPFRPGGEHGEVMQYYQVPEEVLEDVEELRAWVGKALAVAEKKARGSMRRGPPGA